MVPEGAGQEWGSCEALWDSGDKNKPVLSISEKKKAPSVFHCHWFCSLFVIVAGLLFFDNVCSRWNISV
jgi:hypothetical protein